MLFRIFAVFLFLSAAGVLFVGNPYPAAAAEDKGTPIAAEKSLQELGIKATTAAIQSPAKGQDKNRELLVFITYDKPFTGKLQVRGYKADGVEVARSLIKEVSAKAREGGHTRFAFDKDTSFTGVEKFVLTGEAVALKPKQKEESLGEKITNTAKELVQ